MSEDASKLGRGDREGVPREHIIAVRVSERERARATKLAVGREKTVGAIVRELLEEAADIDGVPKKPRT